jgi:23S rRNA (adenine2503-C2)-methyltransferase
MLEVQTETAGASPHKMSVGLAASVDRISAPAAKVHGMGLSQNQMEELFLGWGMDSKKARYHSKQVFKWIHGRFVTDPDQMTDLSKVLRQRLKESFSFEGLKQVVHQVSKDGTRKFLFELNDGKTIESVLIPSDDRLTICVSTQVGCAMGCAFCNTASMGLMRNLLPHEIVGQIWHLQKAMNEGAFLVANAGGPVLPKITNIVFMGMGEPLHNLDHLITSLEILLCQDGLNFSKRKVTVSTSGLVPQIKKLNARLTAATRVNLAISLNGSYDAQRQEVMPVNKAFNIEALLDACRDWVLEPTRRITFEYVLLGGLNDTIDDAERVVRLLKDIPSKVNVIPYNPHPASEFARPTDEALDRFHRYLLSKGVSAMIRHSRGRDIYAACGQLKSAQEGKLNS